MYERDVVPRCTIGPASVPRLFLGDHGYLAKLDSSMTVDEVVESMRALRSTLPVGLSAGEPRVVDAALRALHGRGCRDIMIHTDLRATLGGQYIRYRDVAATMTAHLARFGTDLSKDPVLGFLYPAGRDGSDLTPAIELLDLDRTNAESTLADIDRAGPIVVSIGGDWLDLLLVLGRLELAITGLTEIAEAAAAQGAAVLLTTYFGAMLEQPALEPFLGIVDGLLVPLNHAGYGTLPTLAEHLAWVDSVGLPVIGMHTLSGAATIEEAFSWLDRPSVAALVIGAASPQHQEDLASAARAYFNRSRS